MRYRTPRVPAAAALLIGIAVAAGCSEGGTDSGPGSSGEKTSSSSSWSSPTSSTSPSTSPAPPSPPPSTQAPEPPSPPPSTQAPEPSPAASSGPFVAAAIWAESDYGVTLKVAPTPSGRRAAGEFDAEAAWQEVLHFAPDAQTPGMREQFDCHWTWARLLEPDKPTWNLEPWRPVVPSERMLAEGCNPGGPEV